MISKVCVPFLGKGFDGESGHDFLVKPTVPGDMQSSYLQLRPDETFYVQDLSLTLRPEEQHDELLQLASYGTVPSCDEYSQHVSQRVGDSQACFTPLSRKIHLGISITDTPAKSGDSSPGQVPIIREMAADAIDGNEDSQEWPIIPEKRAVLHALRDVKSHGETENSQGVESKDIRSDAQAMQMSSTLDSLSAEQQVLNLEESPPILSSPRLTVAPYKLVTDATQESAEIQMSCLQESMPPPSPRITKSVIAEVTPAQSRVDGPGVHSEIKAQGSLSDEETQDEETEDEGTRDEELYNEEMHAKKRRRLSPPLEHAPAEESQDSLAGKSISVATRARTPSKDPIPHTSVQRRTSPPAIPATSIPQTPSINNSSQTSPGKMSKSISSTKSISPTQGENSNTTSSQRSCTRILFASSTSVGDSKAYKKFLAAQGIKIVQDFKDRPILCVGKGELKKTSKLLSAVVLGLDVITDEWVVDSARLKTLQEINPYLARDPRRESEWGIKLDEAIERGRQNVQVFKDQKIVFTFKAKKDLGKDGFADLKNIATCAGAVSVESLTPKKTLATDSKHLIIGSPEDADTPALQSLRCFTKDILGLSVLRGHLDLESDEFVVKSGPSQSKGSGKKRKR